MYASSGCGIRFDPVSAAMGASTACSALSSSSVPPRNPTRRTSKSDDRLTLHSLFRASLVVVHQTSVVQQPPDGIRLTDRLRLEPVGPQHAEDLWRLHQDPVVAEWNAGAWSHDEAAAFAVSRARGWEQDGVSKWMAYQRDHGALVGRGGLSRMTRADAVTAQIEALVTGTSWADDRLEVGWALRRGFRGRGYATEIGREALAFANGVLDATVVIAFTEIHNRASRAVMERLEMDYAGEVLHGGLIEGLEGLQDNAPFAVYVICF
jgi:RimJ/RimL family protein N-acetyltransferase